MEVRVSSLYNMHASSRISRTFAVAAYPDVIDPTFQKEHEAIINGEPIGIIPHEHFIGSSASVRNGTIRSAIHVYSLIIKKGGSEFQYASIAEVHHPEILQLQDLAVIYDTEFESHLGKKDKVGDFLEVIKSRIRVLLNVRISPWALTQKNK